MQRFLLSFFLGIALFFGVRVLIRALASDETKIRRVVSEMADGFNATRMNPILDGLAQDFLEETWGADRQMVRQGLAAMFFERKDEVTKGFLYRLRIPEEQFRVTLDGDNAKLELVAEFDELHGEQTKLRWKASIHADATKTPDGWKIRRAKSDSLEGERLR